MEIQNAKSTLLQDSRFPFLKSRTLCNSIMQLKLADQKLQNYFRCSVPFAGLHRLTIGGYARRSSIANPGKDPAIHTYPEGADWQLYLSEEARAD